MGKKSSKDDVIEIKCLNCEDVNMKRLRMGSELVIDQCPDCGGIWFDFIELIDLKELGEFYIKQLEKTKNIAFEKNRIRECPRCGVVLQPAFIGDDNRIKAERCPDCKGIWLDKGELSKIT